MADDVLTLPAINPDTIEQHTGTFYPDSVKGRSEERIKRRIGDALGLTTFGVNLTVLPPGSSSALRHWHLNEDEFVYILSGEATMVSDTGEQILGPGMAAGFPAGKEDGHQLLNNGSNDVVYLEIGNRTPSDEVFYPDNDLKLTKEPGNHVYSDRAGNPLAPPVKGAPGSGKKN